ncbi:Zinc finger RING-type [Arabidopsis thaliana x Arabidopsis arenosa]|uniref:Zinc finger RING-type n=1 Tax=Arabidopsis thaliana x Arabidopsis arenosa TaxID=1240361 RepID=A0A8T2BI44_9BRAS|nr:Zinc finger RING-type [Arabidopsis thaliana x Arabidopsis arenosa]
MVIWWDGFRSRPGRSDPDLESDSSSYRHYSHHHHHRRHGVNHHNQRHDSDGCDPLRRPTPRLRCFCHLPGRSRPIRDVQGTGQYLNTDNTDIDTQSSSFVNLNGSERLPGAVLLARARLFERLRGVSLSSNNRSNRVSLGDDQRESSFHSINGDPIFQLEGLQVTYECNKKPQGLTQDAINCLHRQTFSSAEVNTEMKDCRICLESFTKGDMLISLPCTHSFHSSCLNPWLRACGDCPYCRRAIAKE